MWWQRDAHPRNVGSGPHAYPPFDPRLFAGGSSFLLALTSNPAKVALCFRVRKSKEAWNPGSFGYRGLFVSERGSFSCCSTNPPKLACGSVWVAASFPARRLRAAFSNAVMSSTLSSSGDAWTTETVQAITFAPHTLSFVSGANRQTRQPATAGYSRSKTMTLAPETS